MCVLRLESLVQVDYFGRKELVELKPGGSGIRCAENFDCQGGKNIHSLLPMAGLKKPLDLGLVPLQYSPARLSLTHFQSYGLMHISS